MIRAFLNWINLKDLEPTSLICLREGYNVETLRQDFIAGITIGIISLPLAMAFAIGSGLQPDRGLFTAIVAGFLISLLGGSRVQIGGPTGAFIVIVYAIVQKHGYDGLVVATLLAGLMIMLLGIFRAGALLKFIPYPVTVGLTAGIAVSLFSGQIKDFFGLKMMSVPPNFVDKILQYSQYASTWDPWPVTIGLGSLAVIVLMRKYYPRAPGAIFAVSFATFAAWFFEIPVETIATKFGGIPRMLPEPFLPPFDWSQIVHVFPDAITIALLGSIESLLSAVVSDGLTGSKHRSNTELFAQGIANIFSVIFGGIPATGAVARTSANIKLGAKTPVAGMLHAVTVFILMFAFAPLAAEIPLASLAGLLMYVAWSMSEREHFVAILKGPRGDALILLATFGLTVMINLTVGLQIGVAIAAVTFLKKMTDASTIDLCKIMIQENSSETPQESDLIFRKDVPESAIIFEINGPFFFGISDSLNEALRRLDKTPKYFILRISRMSMIDASGIHALKLFSQKCQKKNIEFLLAGARNPALVDIFMKNGIYTMIGEDHIFTHLDFALAYVRRKELVTTSPQSVFVNP